ncbi:LysR family transcriptional regulator ArgP [Actinoalloteichus hymeniacidonis]|uniref:Transcriptional regulator, LysR family n=1 Tax=Actinoalloteichus hymeniacidonis TaxID=340345 RepID=A0AAC9HSU6_9PSEU|nr:LysR family transcriptional regulator ArgP [Actinoalloteichus hymeniacidonis]AOS64311.1 transcriptional regulator, LysR family [Actinoalloteichus hymeniacidonis]MBB5907621.1 LysR family transcriptional regulator (chromosome initiation inhibitor) [Actinoalloteichus hymeniacidonis]
MPDLPAELVRTLVTAVDEGTFDAAAKVLHLTPSAVSQRIKLLEQKTGRVLLIRSKPVRLTESGVVIARYARQLALLADDALTGLGAAGTGAPTTVSIAVNADSLATWFLAALDPEPEGLPIRYEVRREDQDHTAELLREGLVMAAVTSSAQPVQGCTVRPLGHMRYQAMASRAFVARWLADSPLRQALPAAPVMVFDAKDDLQDAFLRKLTGRRSRGGGMRHVIPESAVYCQAVLSGMGWGMLPTMQVAALPDPTELVALAPDRPVDVALYWQHWRLDSPPLAAVTEAVLAAGSRALLAPS